MKNIFSCLALLFSLSALSNDLSTDLEAAKETAQGYLSAVQSLNYQAYCRYTLPEALEMDEIGSREAMEFWHDEIQQAYENGFSGELHVISLTPGLEGKRPEAIALFKDKDGSLMSFGIFLVHDGLLWRSLGFEEYTLP